MWYSSYMFGPLCDRLAFGKRLVPVPPPKALVACLTGPAVAIVFFSYILKSVSCESALEGALWGIGMGLIFDGAINSSHSLFESRPFRLFAIHSGCHAVGMISVGALLGWLCGSQSA